MTTRTIKFVGLGYGSTPAEITVTSDGTTIFSGTIPTVNQPVPQLPNLELQADLVDLFSIEVDLEYSATDAVVCTVNKGTVLFGETLGNYCLGVNPAYSNEQLAIVNGSSSTVAEKIAVYEAVASTPFTAEELTVLNSANPATQNERTAILLAHDANPRISNDSSYGTFGVADPRSNITVDGVSQTIEHTGSDTGFWWFVIGNGSTLAYDFTVTPGIIM